MKGRTERPNEHDILTGSRPDGTAFPGAPFPDMTCGNWTKSGEGAAMDLLRQLSYLAIGRAACVPVSDGLARDRPGETALGTDFELCWEG